MRLRRYLKKRQHANMVHKMLIKCFSLSLFQPQGLSALLCRLDSADETELPLLLHDCDKALLVKVL